MTERVAPWPVDHAALDVLNIKITLCETPLQIEQRSLSSFVETGTTIWNSALLLIDYFNNGSSGITQWDTLRVLELGCGTGAVGLSLAKRGAQVLLTDRGFILDLARANAISCFPPNGESVRVEELKWASPVDHLPLFDIVVCSDVLYESSSLLSTTLSLLVAQQPLLKIYFAYQCRNEALENQFWSSVSETFQCTRKRRTFVKIRRDTIVLEERDASYRESQNEIAIYELVKKETHPPK